jgi:hypothetical protein
MVGGKFLRAEIVRKKGRSLVNDPLSNKGLAFPMTERDRLSLRGLVPPSRYATISSRLEVAVHAPRAAGPSWSRRG